MKELSAGQKSTLQAVLNSVFLDNGNKLPINDCPHCSLACCVPCVVYF